MKENREEFFLAIATACVGFASLWQPPAFRPRTDSIGHFPVVEWDRVEQWQ